MQAPAVKQLDLYVRTALVALGQSVVKGGQIVLALVLVRLLGEDEWASMALLLSIYIAALGFGTLNLQHSVFFFYGRVPAPERRKLAAQTVGLLATSGLLCAGVLWAIEPLVGGGEFDIVGPLSWLAAALVLETPTLGCSQLFLAAERPGWAAAYDSSMAVVQLTSLCLPVALGFGLVGAFQALFLYAILRVVVSLVLLATLMPPGRVYFDWPGIKEQLVYTAPLALALGTAVLNRGLDKWLVAAIDPNNFGAYAIAAQEVPLIAILPYAVGAVLATRMVHAFRTGQRDRARAYFLAQTSRMSVVVVPASIALILCGEEIIGLLFTERYLAATLPFQIYSVILLHRVTEYGLILRAVGDTRSLWWASAVLLGANVACSVPLTLWLGMLGAALGTLLANAVAWVYILGRVAAAIDTTMTGAFPWAIYLRVLAAGTVAGGVAAYGASGVDSLGLSLLVKLAIYAAAGAVLLWAAGLRARLPEVPAEDDAFLSDIKGSAD